MRRICSEKLSAKRGTVMKRYLSSLLASVLALGLLAGCGGNRDAAAPTDRKSVV